MRYQCKEEFFIDPGIMQKAQMQETLERAEKRRAREFLKSAKGTVRAGEFFAILGLSWTLAFVFVDLLVLLACPGMPVLPGLLVYLLITAAAALYLLRWRIEYDAATGFVQYTTLLRGTQSFHIGELMCFAVREIGFRRTGDIVPNRIYNETTGETELMPLSPHRMTGRHLRLLTIEIPGGKIRILLTASSYTFIGNIEGGNSDAGRFYDYLRFYRQYVLESPDALDELDDPAPDQKENRDGL